MKRTGLDSHVPFDPSPDDLARGLRHVRTEIEAALDILGRLQAVQPGDRVLQAALLEILCIHLRALLFFLESDTRTVNYASGLREENDDILATDFDFPATPLDLPDGVRPQLRRPDRPISCSRTPRGADHARLQLLALALPLLRRCAAFAEHVVTHPAAANDRAGWNTLLSSLAPFARPAPEAIRPSTPTE